MDENNGRASDEWRAEAARSPEARTLAKRAIEAAAEPHLSAPLVSFARAKGNWVWRTVAYTYDEGNTWLTVCLDPVPERDSEDLQTLGRALRQSIGRRVAVYGPAMLLASRHHTLTPPSTPDSPWVHLGTFD